MPEPADTVTIARGAVAALGWFFESSKDAFLAIEGETVRRANPAWTNLTGYSSGGTEGAPLWRFVWPDDRDALKAQVLPLAWRGEAETEARLLSAEGEPIWTRVSFVRGEGGWLLAIVRDIRAERSLRQSEARFRGLVSATTDVIFRMSADWREALEIEGRGVVADTGAPSASWLETYLLPEEQSRVGAAIANSVASETPFHLEVRVRRIDGSTGWAVSRAAPIRDETGRIVEWFGAASDITERRRAEEHLRLMIDELNHRVKNSLATVEAAVYQAFRRARTLDEAEASLKGRMTAIAHATDLLTGDARVGRSLRGVIEASLQAQSDPGRCRLTGSDIELPPRAAHAFTLAIHELATNAVKHGALSADQGRIDVGWTAEPTPSGRRLCLEWRETGGPPASPPARRGFGTRLIERTLASEDGRVTFGFEPSGLVCVMEMQLVS